MSPPVRPIGKLERLCKERQQRDLERWPARTQQDCEPDGYWWDEAAAQRVVDFFPRFLRHHKGEWAGRPFYLEPWQADDILRPVFGWKRPDGSRRFRTAYVSVPRKNGKTEQAAGIALYLATADGEIGAEVYSAATKRDQAKIVHDAAKAMIRRSTELKRFVKPIKNNISIERTDSKFEPLSAESDTLDGLNPHGSIIDELHAHKDRHVREVLLTAMGARRQPLEWIITTAGIYEPTSIGWEVHEYAKNVLEGVFEDETFFAFVACADDEDDWDDPETWWKANPNLGVSVKWDYIANLAQKASRSPSFLNTFLRYHLNRWTQQVERWIPMERWDRCTAPVVDTALRGRRCFGGLDLSSTIDITALVLVFEHEDGTFSLLPRFWVPEETVQERTKRDRVPYDAWVRDGWMLATPGDVVDYDFIREEVDRLAGYYEVVEIAFDPWNAMQIAVKLEEDGVPMVQFRQGYQSMSPASKEFERLVTAGRLRHGGNPVLRWMANNVARVEDPAGNIKPDKKRSREKIDGIVATIMALGRATVSTDDRSVYETRGLTIVGGEEGK